MLEKKDKKANKQRRKESLNELRKSINSSINELDRESFHTQPMGSLGEQE